MSGSAQLLPSAVQRSVVVRSRTGVPLRVTNSPLSSSVTGTRWRVVTAVTVPLACTLKRG